MGSKPDLGLQTWVTTWSCDPLSSRKQCRTHPISLFFLWGHPPLASDRLYMLLVATAQGTNGSLPKVSAIQIPCWFSTSHSRHTIRSFGPFACVPDIGRRTTKEARPWIAVVVIVLVEWRKCKVSVYPGVDDWPLRSRTLAIHWHQKSHARGIPRFKASSVERSENKKDAYRLCFSGVR